jgi:hypothetical protein
MSLSAAQQQLLVIGLCGESIMVNWLLEDTVKHVKDRAYAAAGNTLLSDGTRMSLVAGVSAEQMRLVFGDTYNLIEMHDSDVPAPTPNKYTVYLY